MDTEDSLFWKDLFDDMKERGLRVIKLTAYDGHKGIQKAVNESFHELSLQMCHIHLIRQVDVKETNRSGWEVKRRIDRAITFSDVWNYSPVCEERWEV